MKTAIGYKLFEMNKDGKLFPLFIDKANEVPINEWVHAKFAPQKGFAARGGWHVGEMPDAPWLKGYDGTDVGCYKSRFSKGKRVWCEIEYNNTNDYNDIVSKTAKKCFDNRCPDNGFYFFTECGKGVWVITSDIKVSKILSEEERQKILSEIGHDEIEAYKPYKEAFIKREHNKLIKAIRNI